MRGDAGCADRAGAGLAAHRAGLAAAASQGGDHCGADRSAGVRHGHAFSQRAPPPGAVAPAFGSLGMGAERGGERARIGVRAGIGQQHCLDECAR